MEQTNEVSNTPTNVYIQVSITKIFDIDTITQRFSAEAIIESKWWDPNIKSEDEVFDTKTMWKPELYVENGLEINQNEVNYRIKQEKDEDVFLVSEVRKIKGLFWECFELQNFPLDIQDLSLTIASKRPVSEVRFSIIHPDIRNIQINDTLEKSMWRMHNRVTTRKVHLKREYLCDNRTFPAVRVTAQALRIPGFILWNAVLPILLVTCASLCPFVYEYKTPQSRLPATATMLLTSVSMRWTIGRLLPTVSYLTSLDKYSLASILIIVMELVYHAAAGSLFRVLPAKASYAIDTTIFVFFVFLLCAKQLVFIKWFLSLKKYHKLVIENKIEHTNDVHENKVPDLKRLQVGTDGSINDNKNTAKNNIYQIVNY